MILMHYFKRMLREPLAILIYVFLPMVLVILNVVLNVGIFENPDDQMLNGYSMMATGIMTIIMVMFQFMGGALIIDYYYRDFRDAKRWRLLASPAPLGKFIFAGMLACVVFSVVSGALIIGVSVIFLDAYMYNPVFLVAVLILMAVFSQLLGLLLSLFGLKKATAETIATVFPFAMVVPAGHMFVNLRLGGALDFFFERVTPYAQALNALLYSSSLGGDLFGNQGFVGADMGMALLNLGTLAATTLAMGIAVAVVARRRSF